MSSTGIQRKKLIEVALPLEAINVASAREKSIRLGHPSTLHLWWSRKPLATCRAVLFASIVDDPSSNPEKFPTEEAQEAERQRLFRIIEEIVKWENTNNETVLNAARAEIMKATNGNPPPVLDPFCGGGSIPLEAQRLGLEAHGSDLNPVAVLITKTLIEIPPKFAGRPPVNPNARKKLDHSGSWKGARGLAEDVRYYGKWMRDEAERRVGHLYPTAKLPNGKEAKVLAWLWARTVKCPNPACGAMMPLATKWWLSSKKGKEAWVEPIIDRKTKTVTFKVKAGKVDEISAQELNVGSGYVNDKGKKVKATFRCIICNDSVVKGEYVDLEADKLRTGVMPLAIVANGAPGRTYLAFDEKQTNVALVEATSFIHNGKLKGKIPSEPARGTFASNAQGRVYGFKTFADYFTSRQLAALATFCDLVDEAKNKAKKDAVAAGFAEDGIALNDGGTGGEAYGDAIATLLALAIDRLTMTGNSLVRWNPVGPKAQHSFGMQAIPMIWDFAEPNFFADSTGSIEAAIELTADPLALLGGRLGFAEQEDAIAKINGAIKPLICTDPPYYNNVAYSDLSDFFYVWLRRTVGQIYPDLFKTILVPKQQELVATPHRFDGDKEKARSFFEIGLEAAFTHMRTAQNNEYPMPVFYAFKQTEEDEDGSSGSTAIASTGWETMLEGLVRSSFIVTGTWPIRTEMKTRQVAMSSNALASSIVLVCRLRPEGAPISTRREFLNALKRELPSALKNLQRGNIAPVDLAQAAIGPGMAVFSRYSKVVESDGSPMRVRTALQLINQALDEVLAEQESEYDAETRWAVAWFDQFGMNEGAYGTAETLSKAKNTSVSGMDEAGVTTSRAGKVRLLRRDELPDDWNPSTDRRLTVWEAAQHLIRALDTGGETAAAALLAQVGGMGDVARDLAYRLYTTSERKGWTHEALAYNSLVVAWPEISRLAMTPAAGTTGTLFG